MRRTARVRPRHRAEMDESITLSLADVEELAYAALCASRTHSSNARSVARSLAAAEADGIRSHGLLRLPTYCEHAALGKVNGTAEPSVTRPAAAAVCVDDNAGGPPRTGQFFVALDPQAFLGAQFAPRLEQLLDAMEADPAVRLPGAKRLAARERAATHRAHCTSASRGSARDRTRDRKSAQNPISLLRTSLSWFAFASAPHSV